MMNVQQNIIQDTLSEDCSYKLLKLLGKGTFGKVFLALHEPSKKHVAIKRSPKWSTKYPREVSMLEMMLHSLYLVSLNGVFYTTTQRGYQMQNLVFDYMQMSIGKFIRNKKEKNKEIKSRIEPLTIKYILYQITEGLKDLHAKNIAHRDLKPDNILLNPECDYKVAICDLGSAKIVGENITSIPYICSRWYRAPELLCGSMNYTTAVDLWSLGCIIFELITLHPLFPGRSKKKEQSEECSQLINIMEVLGSPNIDFYNDIKEKTSDKNIDAILELCTLEIEPVDLRNILTSYLEEDEYDLIDIVQGLLKWNPRERTPARDVLGSPYFASIYNNKRDGYTELFKHTKLSKTNCV